MMKKKIILCFSVIIMIFLMVSCSKKTYQIVLNYDENKVEVTINDTINKNAYNEGEVIKATIVAKKGYIIENVIVNNENIDLINNVYQFIINVDTTITVTTIEDEGYSLTIDGNIDFTYDVTSPNRFGKYNDGETITLSINKPTSYEIEQVTINGVETDLIGSACTFVISSDTTVYVTFQSTITYISEAALASIQGKVKIAGNYTLDYPDYSLTFHNYIETIFDIDKVHQYEYSIDDQKETYNVTFFNKNGYATINTIGIDNVIVEDISKELFADYDNPFTDLTTTDFILNEEDGYYYLGKDLNEVAATITGWEEEIVEFKVKVENDKVTEICIATGLISDGHDYYMSVYVLDVTEHATATVEEVKPYEHVSAHDDLKVALEKIGYNYTINHLDHEEGYEDIEYTSYVLDKLTYCGYQEEDGAGNLISYGYLEKDGYVYEFSYDGTTVTIGDALDYSSIRGIQGDFSSFAPEVFEYIGDGRYVARNSDIATEVAYLIGYDRDVKMLGNYATSLEIVIKNNVLYQVIFDYYVYGTEGKVVLTYSDFETTICPISLDNIEQVTVFDRYAGTYNSEDNAHTVVIADQKITIDGTEMVVEGFDTTENSFYGTFNDQEAYVTRYFGMSELMVEYGEEYFVVSNETLYNINTTIPSFYVGTFVDETHQITITETAILCDGVELEILLSNDNIGVVGLLNGVKYYLFLDLDENDNVVCYFLRPDFSVIWVLDYVVTE